MSSKKIKLKTENNEIVYISFEGKKTRIEMGNKSFLFRENVGCPKYIGRFKLF